VDYFKVLSGVCAGDNDENTESPCRSEALLFCILEITGSNLGQHTGDSG